MKSKLWVIKLFRPEGLDDADVKDFIESGCRALSLDAGEYLSEHYSPVAEARSIMGMEVSEAGDLCEKGGGK